MLFFSNHKKIRFQYIIMFILLLTNSFCYGKQEAMSAEASKKFIKEVFNHTVENMQANEEVYARYFSKDYIQHVDGKTLNYDDFLAHMKAQKQAIKSAKVTFKQIVAEDNKVATIHLVKAIKRDGSEVKAQVNAIFQIKDGKIIECDELTFLINGTAADRDLGSRH